VQKWGRIEAHGGPEGYKFAYHFFKVVGKGCFNAEVIDSLLID